MESENVEDLPAPAVASVGLMVIGASDIDTKSPDLSPTFTGPAELTTEANSQISTESHILDLDVDLMHLSVQQLNAIDLLIMGCSDRETADKVGVTRSTVTRWRLYHPAFRAELNAQRAAVWGQAREKLRALIPEAVGVLADAIRDPTNPDRAKLALGLLNSVKVSDGLSSIDSQTDPTAMLREDAYVPPYATLDQASDYQVIGHISRLRARLNGLSDFEYNEAVDAQERAARKAEREAKKKAKPPADKPRDRDRRPVNVDP